MGRRRTYAAVPGDWKVWCIRSHICMASQAIQLWDRHWVCLDHYEVRQPLDSLETKEDGEIAVGMTRGSQDHHIKEFIQDADSLAFVVCGFVEDGTTAFGGPNETAVTITPGGTTTEDHVTGRYDITGGGEYVQFTGDCDSHGAGNRVVTLG